MVTYDIINALRSNLNFDFPNTVDDKTTISSFARVILHYDHTLRSEIPWPKLQTITTIDEREPDSTKAREGKK